MTHFSGATPKRLSHDHGHHHDHSGVFHTHAPEGQMKRAFFWTVIILIVEVCGGLISHSLALLSDAGHVLTDLFALGLSWYALTQAKKPATERMTYGYHRSGILAALINGMTLLVITVIILVEAYQRFLHPTPIQPYWMIGPAAIGLGINLYLGFGMKGHDNLNVRSAVLHMLGDAAASAGVIVAALLIAITHRDFFDPLLSVLIALLIAFGAWRIVGQTVSILMEGTPKGIETDAVVTALRHIPSVEDVHDVHIWSITSGRNALSCHVVLDGSLTIAESQSILRTMEHELEHFGIQHVTIQTEDGSHPHEATVLCAEATERSHGHG
ncbi:MAG: cation diffusion facilitator family transporter [Alicyclobacillaceae bacterium]|nr:cation diffusion facilitator family transporter [Alicyclobacillaceae bacterium]